MEACDELSAHDLSPEVVLVLLIRISWTLVLNLSQGCWVMKEAKTAERMEKLGLVLNSLLWVQSFILWYGVTIPMKINGLARITGQFLSTSFIHEIR